MNVHPTFPLKIQDCTAKLILMACPGTQQVDLMAALKQLKESGISAVVTLMTKTELEALSLSHIGVAIKSLGMSWFHLPIENEHCPERAFEDDWQTAGVAIHRLLEKQKSVAIHCQGGSGRTGLVAGKILLERGEPLKKVVKRIQKLRPNAFQLAEQRAYIESIEDALISA